MKQQLINVVIILLLAGWITTCTKKEIPKPYGAIPSERQLIWHDMKYHAFIHFGPNTFTDMEWGHGDESPDVFNPTALDCQQWAKVIKEAGMKGVIITAKHHDGFCLWPSEYSAHTVRESRWRDGKGDVLKDLSDACREYGIKFGIYISPWDRNHPTYFTDEYNNVFKKMLEEVLTNYGEVYYVFFDGAFSVGPDGKRQEYDWAGFTEVVRKYQPNAVIFSDGGPDIRWIGNERGYAAETNWCTVKKGAFYPGISGVNDQLQTGHEDGELWIPSEVNTSIRPGWFYHKQEDDRVKSLNRLIDNWYHSVGMNGNFLLNLPPDTRGLIHENDIKRLLELKKYLDEAFALNLAEEASAKATNSRGKAFSATKAIDGDPETYWAAEDDISSVSLELDLGKPIEVNAVLIQEYIKLGQRVKSFAIEAFFDDNFTEVATGATIGNRRIVKFNPLTTQKLRINITAKACPLISYIGVYRVQDLLEGAAHGN
ncbi:MAG: alpha-L-fucosidase [Candidatus Aminicenantes bacterium]|nr:MAG: alpha-L-fucosidase [Candidatus Aminicenantes bacterium]